MGKQRISRSVNLQLICGEISYIALLFMAQFLGQWTTCSFKYKLVNLLLEKLKSMGFHVCIHGRYEGSRLYKKTMGVECISVNRTAGDVKVGVTFMNEWRAEDKKLSCSILVGSDGARSTVQRRMRSAGIAVKLIEILRKLDGLAEDIQKRQPPVDLWRNFIYCTSLCGSLLRFNEEMIETLFGCDSETKGMGNVRREMGLRPVQENVVLDPKKSHNIAILLRALNISEEEVCEALLEGNTDSLVNELLETLLKMAPSKEEEIKLREYRDEIPSNLGPAEKFLKAMLDIPFVFKRVDAMLYISNLSRRFITLKSHLKPLSWHSCLFRKPVSSVRKTGNRMNVGTNRGDAHAFKFDTLLKLVDVKGTDGKTTLLHFVVQEISRSQGFRAKSQTKTVYNDVECTRLGLQIVSGLGSELSNAKKASSYHGL